MAGKKLTKIYSEEAMLADAKARQLKVVHVTSMIKESGSFNEYVDSIKYIICGHRTIGVVHKHGKVDELCAVIDAMEALHPKHKVWFKEVPEMSHTWEVNFEELL